MILTPTHPLWLAGFRPFFLLAFVSGATLPVGWLLILFGVWPAPDSAAGSAVVWHAHEMFYGFGWAMLGGFLLTASKNWVKGRGVHGRTLMFLTLAWLFDRLAMGFGAAWPAPLFLVASQLFLITIVALLVWALARHHRQDAYPDNLYFILALPLFPLAKWLLLQPGTFALGLSMTIGLFRLAFLLMLERTLPPFMQRAFRIVLPRNHWLDGAIRLLGFVLIFERLLPPPLAGGLAIALATLLVVRLAFWSPHRALRQIEVGIMVLGYGMLVVQLLIAAPALALHPAWVGAVPVHLFAFGVMGLIIPAMQVRIAKGHTGRDPVFDRTDRMVLWLMLLALGARVVAPQIFPTGYSVWLALAAGCWFAGFATLAVRYSPFLLQARVDGRKY